MLWAASPGKAGIPPPSASFREVAMGGFEALRIGMVELGAHMFSAANAQRTWRRFRCPGES